MSVDVKVPEVGESITEGILVEWVASDGDVVQAEDPLFELETDKVTMTVNAERSGRLSISVGEGETVEVGQVVGSLDPDATDAAEDDGSPDGEKDEPAEKGQESSPGPQPEQHEEEEEKKKKKEGVEGRGAGEPHLSPAVRRLVEEHDLDPAAISGSGKGGRILKEDVLRHIEEQEQEEQKDREAPAQEKSEEQAGAKPEPKKPAAVKPFPGPRTRPDERSHSERQTREAMSRLRLRVAERLVQVQQTAAILTTFNEADMSRVMALRSRFKESFRDRHEVGLGFMSFFVKAVVDALMTVPRVNAFIEGDEVVHNHYYDIGVAVSTDRGLVVPVLRDADRLSMAEIEAGIADLADRAQQRRLELAELQGAVFTISNGGVFGSMMSTPILNPPGSAILGMHAIQKRPVAVDDEVVIRPMMYLALSYDHRLIDGAEAVTFLKRIKECIEDPERMLLEV